MKHVKLKLCALAAAVVATNQSFAVEDLYGNEVGLYGPYFEDGSWNSLHRDGRNSDFSVLIGPLDRDPDSNRNSDYTSRGAPNNPVVWGGASVVSPFELPDGNVVHSNCRGEGFSTLNKHVAATGEVIWKSEKWTGRQDSIDGVAFGPETCTGSPIIDEDGFMYVWDNDALFKADSDDGKIVWSTSHTTLSGLQLGSTGQAFTDDRLVGGVAASGVHFWLDMDTGEPKIFMKEPIPYASMKCPPIVGWVLSGNLTGGEIDSAGQLTCAAIGSNAATPQSNITALIPKHGAQEHDRYIFTYAGREGQFDSRRRFNAENRVIAYDIVPRGDTDGDGDADFEGVEAWQTIIRGPAGASPSVTPDLDTIYVPDPTVLNIIDTLTGERNEDVTMQVSAILSPAVTDEGVLISCSGSGLLAVNPDGSKAWESNFAALGAQTDLKQKVSIPFIVDGTPVLDCNGITMSTPTQVGIQLVGGYMWWGSQPFAKISGEVGRVIPQKMYDVYVSKDTGSLLSDLDAFYDGTPETMATVTRAGYSGSGRFEVLQVLYYYVVAGNLGLTKAGISLRESLPTNALLPVGYSVEKPVGGYALYHPESFADLVRLRLLGAQDNGEDVLRLTGADASSADLQQAFLKVGWANQILKATIDAALGEAIEKEEITPATAYAIQDAVAETTPYFDAARAALLSNTPGDPNQAAIDMARENVDKAIVKLQSAANILL